MDRIVTLVFDNGECSEDKVFQYICSNCRKNLKKNWHKLFHPEYTQIWWKFKKITNIRIYVCMKIWMDKNLKNLIFFFCLIAASVFAFVYIFDCVFSLTNVVLSVVMGIMLIIVFLIGDFIFIEYKQF